MAPLMLTLNPFTELLPAVLASLGSVAMEVLVPKRGMVLPLGDSVMIPLNWKTRVPLAYAYCRRE